MTAGPPNILWIVTTQWRARALGYAGDRNARTPCLDAFADRGSVHAAAMTPHPFGPFARAAILTGMPSPANGVREYFDPLPVGARTIAHDMSDRGYVTGWFGKWHLARRDPAVPLVGEAHARMIVPPEARGGFSLWEGFESGFLLNDPWLHGTRLPEPVRMPGYQSDVLAQRTMEWIRESRQAGAPWFGVVSLESPHPPYNAPAPAESVDPAGLVLDPNVPRGGEVEAKVRHELAGYYTHIAATDCAIGRLIEAVNRACLDSDRETIVVFTSVHGDMHGAHGLFRKGWPYEESVGVPLIIRRFGRKSGVGPEGRTENRPVSLLDLPAMTAAWADGRPWAPESDTVTISMPGIVRLRYQCDRGWKGVRSRAWKAIFHDDGTPWLVFDLKRDPWERENLAGEPGGAEIIAQARDVEGL